MIKLRPRLIQRKIMARNQAANDEMVDRYDWKSRHMNVLSLSLRIGHCFLQCQMGCARPGNSQTHQANDDPRQAECREQRVTTPDDSVTAKPRPGPLPTKNKMHAAISVGYSNQEMVASAV